MWAVRSVPCVYRRMATSDVTAVSVGQVNRRARSTNQTPAASTRDLTRTLRTDHDPRKSLDPCSFPMCGGEPPAPLTGGLKVRILLAEPPCPSTVRIPPRSTPTLPELRCVSINHSNLRSAEVEDGQFLNRVALGTGGGGLSDFGASHPEPDCVLEGRPRPAWDERLSSSRGSGLMWGPLKSTGPPSPAPHLTPYRPLLRL